MGASTYITPTQVGKMLGMSPKRIIAILKSGLGRDVCHWSNRRFWINNNDHAIEEIKKALREDVSIPTDRLLKKVDSEYSINQLEELNLRETVKEKIIKNRKDTEYYISREEHNDKLKQLAQVIKTHNEGMPVRIALALNMPQLELKIKELCAKEIRQLQENIKKLDD